MISLIVHLLITSILILFIASQVRGIEVDSWGAALMGAIALGLINVIIYPVVAFITIPFTIITFGLFLFVIHACMFKLSASVVSGFRVRGFLPALYGSVALTLMNLVISIFI